MKKVEVTVWVCPACGTYYGATGAGNLHKIWNRDAKGYPTHRRSQCPNCQALRKPYIITIEIPGE